MNPQGTITRESRYPVDETIERIMVFLQQHGAKVYARINQQSELARVGIVIRPLEFLLFGNPAAGGKIMAENPLAALDLPLRIIAWEDGNGETKVTYQDADYIKERYDLRAELLQPLNLAPMLAAALGPE